jgi:uncharacterized protein YfbU (UPF0304 family)
MKLSNGEKLILILLTEIYDKLGIDGETDSEFIQSAIFSDNLWGLSWKFSGIPFEKSETPPIVHKVVNILDAWSFIEESYEGLSEEDKLKVEKGAYWFGKNPKFRGFDGNNETEYMSIARFLIDDLNRFQRFKGRELNSHNPSVDGYLRISTAFEPMRATIEPPNLLSADQLIELLNEHVYPSNR